MPKKIEIVIPEMEDCAFRVEALPEDTQIEGNCSAIDEATDKLTEARIREELESGNEWAWCCVRVTCYYDNGLNGIDGTTYLGCCSYANEADFITGGYFQSMKEDAYLDFVAKIEALQRRD